MREYSLMALWVFNITYLFCVGAYFLQDLNYEFIIYVLVILVIIGGVLLVSEKAQIPHWLLWLLSIWGLMHVFGGAVQTENGVLFAYRIFSFLDLGGEFYILKYDQLVHFYLYGVVALLAAHIYRVVLQARQSEWLVGLASVLTSVGISALNEIMEFLIAVSIERNGVGGYENAMLDLIFNLTGATLALVVYKLFNWKKLD